jgi:hypothetical protein
MNIYRAKYCQDKIFYGYEYLRSRNSKFGNVGTPYYVGKGKGFRFRVKHHVGISVPKDKSKIQLTPIMNEADAFQWEIFQIYLHGRIDLDSGCLRNRTNGGDGASFRAGQIAWNKGIPRTSEEKLKMSLSKLGKKTNRTSETFTEIWKENLSNAAKKRNLFGKNNPRYGKSPFEYMNQQEIELWKSNRSKRYTGSGNPRYGKKKMWITNDIIEQLIDPEKWSIFENDSFHKGRLIKK